MHFNRLFLTAPTPATVGGQAAALIGGGYRRSGSRRMKLSAADLLRLQRDRPFCGSCRLGLGGIGSQAVQAAHEAMADLGVEGWCDSERIVWNRRRTWTSRACNGWEFATGQGFAREPKIQRDPGYEAAGRVQRRCGHTRRR